MEQGKITKGIGGFYYVDTGAEVVETRARGKFRNMGIKPMVGDLVEIENNYVYEILPRANELVRPPVANVDQIAVVVAAREPEADLFLVDKLTVQAVHQGIGVLVVVNKADLDGKRAREIAGIYDVAGFASVVVSVHDRGSIDGLMGQLAGKTTAFAGNSGVGKSSILKIFGIDAPTGELSKINRGKHTTRHVELFKLGADAYVLDTPGFSMLELAGLEKGQIAGCFPEFADVECEFADCTHMPKEQGCGAAAGLSAGRLASYRKLYEMMD